MAQNAPDTKAQRSLANFQEQDWIILFNAKIASLVQKGSYEDNNVRITYTAKNTSEFAQIRKVTSTSQNSLEKDFLIDIEVENKDPQADLSKITYSDIPIAKVPLYTTSGFYINGVTYSARSESTLAPGWYQYRSGQSHVLVHRSKWSENLHIRYQRGRFMVSLNTARGRTGSVDLWCFLKAISESESFSDILARLNKSGIFMNDYILAQKSYEANATAGSLYTEPSVEDCAKTIIKSWFKNIVGEVDYVSYIKNYILNDNRLNADSSRKVSFGQTHGICVGLDKPLGRDVKYKGRVLLARGHMLTAKDLDLLKQHDIDHVYIEFDDQYYKLFDINLHNKLTLNEIVCAIYYFGLYVSGLGVASNRDDFKNKSIKTVGTLVSGFIDQQLVTLTEKILSNYRNGVISSMSKVFASQDLRILHKKQLSEVICKDPAYNLQDDTNSIASYEQGFRITGGSQTLGKGARMVQPWHANRVCGYTTPESKAVGLNLSLTAGSRVESGYVTAPMLRVTNGKTDMEAGVVYIDNTEELNHVVAPFSAKLDNDMTDPNELIQGCRLQGRIIAAKRADISYQEYSSIQSMSPVLLFIPGFNHNSGKRLTMAANALTQARPPISRQRGWVTTGMEAVMDVNTQTARDILNSVISELGADVKVTESTQIKLIEISTPSMDASAINESGTTLVFTTNIPELDRFTYNINRQQVAMNNSIKHQRVITKPDNLYDLDDMVICNNDTDQRYYELDAEEVKFGHIEKSVNRLHSNAVAFGEPVKVMFKGFRGAGYEDSVIIRRGFVESYGLATINMVRIRENAVEERSPNGMLIRQEVFTNNLSSSKTNSDSSFYQLDGEGLPRVGSELNTGQVVIGKQVRFKSDVRNKSVTLKIGQSGVVLSRQKVQSLDTPTKKITTATVTLGSIRKVGVGDKLGGMHGNKGVIGWVVDDKELPVFESGIPDIILNELGVQARMNIGQLVEMIMGAAGYNSGKIQVLSPFSEKSIEDIIKHAKEYGVEETTVYDGKTGLPYERKALLGNMYFLRSSHVSDSKYNVCGLTNIRRNTVSQQPIKCFGGGQRIGELNANAIRGHNAIETLESLFTIQSDDVAGHKQLVSNIEAGTPMKDIRGRSHCSDFFLSHFRVLGLNIEKDSEKGTNRMVPLRDEDIRKLSLKHIDANSMDSTAGYTGGALFLRDTHHFNEYSASASRDQLEREGYSSLALPEPIIMPLMCYGSRFLNMFLIKTNREIRHMSTVAFKRILFQGYVLLDKNFTDIPEIMKRSTAIEAGCFDEEKALSGVSALMCIFRNFNLLHTIAAIEKSLGIPEGDRHSTKMGYKYAAVSVAAAEEDSDAADDHLGLIANVLEVVGAPEASAVVRELEDEDINTTVDIGTTNEDKETLESEIDSEADGYVVPAANNGEGEQISPEGTDEEFDEHKPKDGEVKELKVSGIKGYQVRADCINFLKDNRIEEYFVSSVLIPPIAYRPDFDGRIASPIDKQLGALRAKLLSYQINHNHSTLNAIYQELFWMIVRKPKMDIKDKTIFEMLVSHENKNSKVRDTLFAKRVLGSARSVITVDPTLKMGQARVPISIAVELFGLFLQTEPIVHFPVLNAHLKRHDVTDLEKDTRLRIFECLATNNILEFKKLMNMSNVKLQTLKDVFANCLDELIKQLNAYLRIYPAILNREPSLHKFNSMVFEGIVTLGDSICLHPLACRPYNADFDGDQMSITIVFVPRAITEAREKMAQQNNLVNPNNGELIVDINQDIILGLYWLTMPKSNQTRIDLSNIRKVYSAQDGLVKLSAMDKFKNDLDLYKVLPSDVIFIDIEGKPVVCFAEDALYGMVSERMHPSFDGRYMLVSSRQCPADSVIAKTYVDDVSEPQDSEDTYINFINTKVKPIFTDIEAGRIIPQDVVMLVDGKKKYITTAGRLIFNAAIPGGLTDIPDTSTDYPEETGICKVKYNVTTTSGVMKTILRGLTDQFNEGVLRDPIDPNSNINQIWMESNQKYCAILDRFKDMGFYMSDMSCISISLQDFWALDVAKKNKATLKYIMKVANETTFSSETVDTDKLRNLLSPIDTILRKLTAMRMGVNNHGRVRNMLDLDVLLNWQHNSMFDLVTMRFGDEWKLMTIAQAKLASILGDKGYNFPIGVDGLLNILANSGLSPNMMKTTFRKAMSDITLFASKECICLMKYIEGSNHKETEFEEKLHRVTEKFNEGRLTEQRRLALVQEITSAYKNDVQDNIRTALDDQRNSNLFISVESGARGNMNQLMEVCGTIGIATDNTGTPIETPIRGNLLNGLNSTEMFMASYHARSILVDTQKDIPASGTLNYQLSNLTEYIQIRQDTESGETFCHAEPVQFPLVWEPNLDVFKNANVSLLQQQDVNGNSDVEWNDLVDSYLTGLETHVLTEEEITWINAQGRHYDKYGNRLPEDNLEIPHEQLELRIKRNQEDTLIPYTELRRGQELCINQITPFTREFTNEFIQTCSISNIRDLVQLRQSRKLYLEHQGSVREVKVTYSLSRVSRNCVYYRSIELSKLSPEIQEIAVRECLPGYGIETTKSGKAKKLADIISNRFLRTLESTGNYVSDLPIYTMIGCKSTTGVCQKCFGLKYDTSQMPVMGELIGFQGVQAVCSTLSQMILDTHKSSESAGATSEMERLAQLIDSTGVYEEVLDRQLETTLKAIIGNGELPLGDKHLVSVAYKLDKSPLALFDIEEPVESFLKTSVSMSQVKNGLIKILEGRGIPSEVKTLFVRMCVWFDFIDMLKTKNVLARNLELFPQALCECMIAEEDYDGPDGRVFVGCVYPKETLDRLGVSGKQIKLSMEEALGNNRQVYADCFVRNTRSNIVKHVLTQTDDRGSPIGNLVTGDKAKIHIEECKFKSIEIPKDSLTADMLSRIEARATDEDTFVFDGDDNLLDENFTYSGMDSDELAQVVTPGIEITPVGDITREFADESVYTADTPNEDEDILGLETPAEPLATETPPWDETPTAVPESTNEFQDETLATVEQTYEVNRPITNVLANEEQSEKAGVENDKQEVIIESPIQPEIQSDAANTSWRRYTDYTATDAFANESVKSDQSADDGEDNGEDDEEVFTSFRRPGLGQAVRAVDEDPESSNSTTSFFQ